MKVIRKILKLIFKIKKALARPTKSKQELIHARNKEQLKLIHQGLMKRG